MRMICVTCFALTLLGSVSWAYGRSVTPGLKEQHHSLHALYSPITVFSSKFGDSEGKLGCFRQAYSRGTGSAPSTCPSDKPDRSGGLCYPFCDAGYDGKGPLCMQHCPERFEDLVAVCGKPDVYGRGVGYPLWQADKCRAEHSQGCDRWGLLYYPRCREGFHNWGCCLCTPPCVDGMKDLGVACSKATYGRGMGKAPGCETGKEQDALLCYDTCSPGFSGFGPLCWAASCPPDFPAQCGPICAADRDACGTIGAALGHQIANIALSSSAFVACATSTFDSFGAAVACWGMAIAKASNSGSAAQAFWQDNFIMCAADDPGGGGGGGAGQGWSGSGSAGDAALVRRVA